MYEIKYREKSEIEDSNVEWIGNIPFDWNTGRIQRYFSNKSEKVSDKEFEPLSVTKNGILKQLENVAKTDNGDNRKKVLQGDFVINSRADRKGSCGVSPYDGSVSLICHVLRPKGKIDSIYANHLFRNYYFSEEFYRWGTGIVDDLWSTNKERMAKIIIPVPPFYEQQKIANFLDIKTAQFDNIISKKEKLIQKLEEAKKSLISEVVTGKVKIVDGKLVERDPSEMKDSGVEWLGMIPKDWEIKKVKHLSSVISKGTTPSTVGREILDEGEIKFIKAENILNNELKEYPEFYIDDKTNKILRRSSLKENDLLFVIAGATIGKVAIVRDNMCPANTNQAISFIRLDKPEITQYLFYWLQSAILHKHMWLLAVQAAQPNLSMVNLGNFAVPFPEEQERKLIIEYLNNSNQEMQNLLDKTKLQIHKLKQAKQSLISEAVTGKIDLRDWEIVEEGVLQ